MKNVRELGFSLLCLFLGSNCEQIDLPLEDERLHGERPQLSHLSQLSLSPSFSLLLSG
jgi:hypothetical protein